MKILAQKLDNLSQEGQTPATFDPAQSTTHRGQMIPKQPLIIIFWMYSEMVRWMNMGLIGFVDGAHEDFGSKIGQSDLSQEGQTPATF
jgi:hypothetical protein